MCQLGRYYHDILIRPMGTVFAKRALCVRTTVALLVHQVPTSCLGQSDYPLGPIGTLPEQPSCLSMAIYTEHKAVSHSVTGTVYSPALCMAWIIKGPRACGCCTWPVFFFMAQFDRGCPEGNFQWNQSMSCRASSTEGKWNCLI